MVRMKNGDGQRHVWRKNDIVLIFECTNPILETGGKGLMVWGCISANVVSKIILLEGTANYQVYLNLMKNFIVPESNWRKFYSATGQCQNCLKIRRYLWRILSFWSHLKALTPSKMLGYC